MKLRQRAIGVLLLVLSLPVLSPLKANQEVPAGKYPIYGPGQLSCGKWVEERANKQNPTVMGASMFGWVTGFVSGAGAVGRDMKLTDGAGLLVFVDQYCAGHPLDSVANAARKLVEELTVRTP